MPQSAVEDALHELDKLMVRSAVSVERERCAKIAEGQAEFIGGKLYEKLCHDIAALIRKR